MRILKLKLEFEKNKIKISRPILRKNDHDSEKKVRILQLKWEF